MGEKKCYNIHNKAETSWGTGEVFAMTRDNIFLKGMVILIGVAWIAITVWLNFDAFVGKQGFDRPDVAQRLANCEGTFKQRYDCKSSQIVTENQGTFLDLSLRGALIFLPPILLWVGWSQLPERRRRYRRMAH